MKSLIRKIEIADIAGVAVKYNYDLEVVAYGYEGNEPNDETAKKLSVKRLLDVLINADEFDGELVKEIKKILEYVLAGRELVEREEEALAIIGLDAFLYEE